MTPSSPNLRALLDEILTGRLTRREAVRRGLALGLSLPALVALLRQHTAAQEASAPPDAPEQPQLSALPGGVSVDPYAWLENPDDPEAIAYLEAENAYTEAVMAPTTELQETLYQELMGRIKQTDTSLPYAWHGYLYYVRFEEGKDYAILCRKQGSEAAPEQIVLDFNTIAGDYLGIGGWSPSPDNRYLAYQLDQTGAEIYTIYVLDMETGQDRDQLPESSGFAWGNDSRSLYYCKQDAAQGTWRTYALFRHTLGDDPAADAQLYEEADERFWLGVATSKDQAYLFLYSGAFDSTEVHYMPADQPDAGLKLFVPRQPGVIRGQVEHHGDQFLILTDEGAPNFRLMATPEANPDRANWRDVIPHREDALLQSFDVFERYLAVFGREDGFTQIWVRDLASGTMEPLAFDEAVYSAYPGANPEFATTKLQITYSSPVTPWSVIEVDMATGERTLLKQEEVIGGHDPDAYVSERLFATAPDGAQIPISLVYRRDGPAGPRPMLLYGYGGYEISSDPGFDVNLLTLLDRGMAFAIAHVRGGAELGRGWWEAARLLSKRTTFSDFIACAEHLIAEGHTAPDRLSIQGGSAGGLLVGAVATERPDIFAAVVADVPLVDVVGFLLRSPIGPINRGELGDPHDPTTLRYIRSYAPYDNVRSQAYPAMLVTAGLNDTRVDYWNPAKWVAKLRDTATGDDMLLLRTEMGAGHAGVSSFYEAVRQTAFVGAFLLQTLGLTEVEPAGGVATPVAAKRPDVLAAPARAVAAHHPVRMGRPGRKRAAGVLARA